MVINVNNKRPKGIKDALEISLEAEEEITSSVNQIYELATKLNDYRTKVFLSWFIEEQLEEESNAMDMIEEYDTFNDNGGLFDLDKKYHKRVYVNTNMEIA